MIKRASSLQKVMVLWRVIRSAGTMRLMALGSRKKTEKVSLPRRSMRKASLKLLSRVEWRRER